MHSLFQYDQTATCERLSFRVGRDRTGRWLAVESHGLRGGLFATRDAALDYARAETDHRPGGVQLVPETIALR